MTALRHVPGRKRGAALMVCIFVTTMTAAVVVAVLDAETLQMTALRQTLDYERALYLAGAAAHHAMAELEEDSSWRDGIAATEFPAGSGNFYQATVADDGQGGVVITATGMAGAVTRRVEVTIDFDG